MNQIIEADEQSELRRLQRDEIIKNIVMQIQVGECQNFEWRAVFLFFFLRPPKFVFICLLLVFVYMTPWGWCYSRNHLKRVVGKIARHLGEPLFSQPSQLLKKLLHNDLRIKSACFLQVDLNQQLPCPQSADLPTELQRVSCWRLPDN